VEVDLAKTIGPLDHIWANAGSDRAAITLREQWRKDLTRFHEEAGLKYVRFHGIFNDELGVYAPSIQSQTKTPNWQNIDRVYDGLIERGVRPLVELSFMPKRLASGEGAFGFYRGNITPPKDQAEWGAFITAFTQHLIARYGIEEIRQWPFEVWNEPDLMFFWSGKQPEYFELYKTTVTAIKAVDAKIRVGGPATSGIKWIPEFLTYCETNKLPVDFVSTHLYVGDNQKKLFGEGNTHPLSDVVPIGMATVRAQIDATTFKGAPLWLTEWASDSPAMIVHIIKGCLGNVQLMSQWTLTNTYEELGVADFVLKEGNNGYGMIAAAGIPKPQFNTYKLLHRLGGTRLAATDGPVLASRRADSSAAVAVWNLAEVKQPGGIPGASAVRDSVGEPKKIRVVLKGARSGQKVNVTYVDLVRGSPYPEWRRLGSPQYPTMVQIEAIRKSAELAAPETMKLGKGGELILDLPPECLALIETAK
jgi:xylan 1,4-beta-xylosidase